MAQKSTIFKYDTSWQAQDLAAVEIACIRAGGKWKNKSGKQCGYGLFYHYRELQSILWPEESHTRWTDLILSEILANRVTAVIGPGSSWKTHSLAKYALTDYFCFPKGTGIIISSTDMKGLERRVWGDIKALHRSALELFEWLPGHVVDYLHVIVTDDLEEEGSRVMKDGIFCVPCVSSSGSFMGLGKYVGFKNDRVRCLGDEFQFMEMSMLAVQDNYVHNDDYKFVPIGNPNPTQPENPLHYVAEPKAGWNSIPDDGKTKVWDCKFMSGRCINLDGRDSPNNDFPENEPIRWPKLTNRRTLKLLEETYGKESENYYTQGCGVVKLGVSGAKILPRELMELHRTMEGAVWLGTETVKIGMLDAAYSGVGGDRCVLGWLEFGTCNDGQIRILFHPFMNVPVVVRKDMIAEDQIAEYCRDRMQEVGVLPENFFFDGRGSLATSLARAWSPQVNSVEFGGKPTKRPVSQDIYTVDKDGVRRHRTADEHYSKFVTELWYSMRYAAESDQIRGLTIDIILDGAPREYKRVAGDRIEAETKADMKKRTFKSPDLMDCAVTGLEGARRRGFQIKRIGTVDTEKKTEQESAMAQSEEFDQILRDNLLVHA